MKSFTFILLNIAFCTSIAAAPAKKLDAYWQPSSTDLTINVDHKPWQLILDNYLTIDAKEQTFFSYAKVTPEHKKTLNDYINKLSSINPLELTRVQQKAYWINLYNAATVELILNKYPVKSITKLGKGLFAFGPWDDKLLTVNDRKLTLNDIEHRILRPIYNDERIHYAVNCASFSCPNLAPQAYTKDNTEALLEQGATQYINHSRGAAIKGNSLVLSTIYDWYQDDFGSNKKDVVKHLLKYAKPNLKATLTPYSTGEKTSISYDYNWALNEKK